MNTIGFGLCALLAASASATVIDNGQFGANIGSVGGMFGSDIYAQSFTCPSDNLLTEFGMWLQGGGQGTAPAVRIDLWADDGTNHPDENNVIVAGTTWQGDLPELTRIDTFTSTALTPGQRYWVVINGMIDQNSQGTYNSSWDVFADTIPGERMDWSNDLGSSWSFGIGDSDWAVRIVTTEVPAPGAAALLGLGGLVSARRRRA
jgi:MYXO-CTERM domain-containing protein